MACNLLKNADEIERTRSNGGCWDAAEATASEWYV
jgi:hypothetical protein